jgi:Macrocin-O-methyltransferase (TylF)
MAHHTVAGWLGLALSIVAILVVLRHHPPQTLLPLHCPAQPAADDSLRQLYLHTVKHSVTGMLLQTPGYINFAGPLKDLKQAAFDHKRRLNGEDWPVTGEDSMTEMITSNVLCCAQPAATFLVSSYRAIACSASQIR